MLNIKAFGLAGGIMWAVVGAWATIMALVGVGSAPFDLIDQFYLGWMMPSYPGIALNVVLCFVDGLIAGMIFAWLYNRFAKPKA
ncbi:MAG TPA: hypothetical protein PLZ86_06495 [bacterium]|nr:hypothetical protein [bacterium]